MKLRNLSTIKIPRTLWRGLADGMQIGGVLPQAVRDELGMYESKKTLRVTINPERNRGHKDTQVTLGTYTFGHISLFPCPKCTVGFLTHVYLHELCHAWLHQHHERLYETHDSCVLSDRFTNDAYRIIGGRLGSHAKCSDFLLSIEEALQKLTLFREYADTLTMLTEKHRSQTAS